MAKPDPLAAIRADSKLKKGWLGKLLDSLSEHTASDPLWVRKYGDRATGAEVNEDVTEKGVETLLWVIVEEYVAHLTDQLERAGAENARLREALRKTEETAFDWLHSSSASAWNTMARIHTIARTALASHPTEET